MSKSYLLLKNTKLVNEGVISHKDILIVNDRIERIDDSISMPNGNCTLIDVAGKIVMPGIIDDQVHFREPGLTHKGDIATESASAIAGGVTSYIEQPNTVPQATTVELLNEKYDLAAGRSFANYGFNIGATNDNIEEVLKAENSRAAGVKVFMGSSTGNMLVDNIASLEKLFSESPLMIITHCEDESIIRANTEKFKAEKSEPRAAWHPIIRSREACIASSSLAIDLAEKFGSRLHVYHISTAEEAMRFSTEPLIDKRITAEACIHHLWFSDEDYAEKGNFIKWNPAVKTAADREAIWKAVLENRIDIIATDHAPHTLEEKSKGFWEAPSGGPLVQHSLVAMMEFYHKGVISLETIVQKMCHNPAILFGIQDRGFIREGYYADLAIVHPSTPWTVKRENVLSKCGWSPFEGQFFKSKVTHTIINGQIAYQNGAVQPTAYGQALDFIRRR
ncbi:MAG: dihydroorotase [Flavobacteriales bacterium]|nr:MAG: dihydroorotase [Flavobacteriales bacterium]